MTKKALLLITLLVTDIVLFGAIVGYFPLPANIGLQAKLVSAVLAHWFLLGFWLSFGAMKAPWRQLIATSLLAIVCAVAAPIDGVPNMAAVRGLLILAVTWFFYAALFFPRRLLGLRIGWSERESVTKSSSQFGLGALLGFMAVISVPLALCRLAFGIDGRLAWLALWEINLLFAPTCVIMLPFGLAIFATQNRLRNLAFSLLWVVTVAFAIKHFHPSTAGGPINWEALAAISGLINFQVIVMLVVARLLGLHWLGAGAAGKKASHQPICDTAENVTLQGLAVGLAIASCVLLLIASPVFQFIVVFVLFAAAPCLIALFHFWRRTRPNAFWIAFLIAAALPWAGAFYLGATEASVLLWGKSVFVSTSPVEVTPISGLDWPEVIGILFAPLVIGTLGGVLTLGVQHFLARHRRRRLAHLQVVPAAKPAA